MPTYDRAPASVSALIAERIASGHYPDLEEAEVKVSAWFAFGKEDDDGPALKQNGQPTPIVAKINNPKDRLEGKADVSFNIDERLWRDWSGEKRAAEIDEALEGLEVCRAKITKKNKIPYILSDKYGRPKLKRAVADIYLVGFSRIARRHGAESPEVQMAGDIKNAYGQILFAWGDDNAPGDDIPEIRLSGKTVGAMDEESDEDAA